MISFHTTVYGAHYIRFTEQDVVDTKELLEDVVYADFAGDGTLVGVQIFSEDSELRDFLNDFDSQEEDINDDEDDSKRSSDQASKK